MALGIEPGVMAGAIIMMGMMTATVVWVVNQATRIPCIGWDRVTNDVMYRRLKRSDDQTVTWKFSKKSGDHVTVPLPAGFSQQPRGWKLKGLFASNIFILDLKGGCAIRLGDAPEKEPGDVERPDPREWTSLLSVSAWRNIAEGSKRWWEQFGPFIVPSLVIIAISLMALFYMVYKLSQNAGTV